MRALRSYIGGDEIPVCKRIWRQLMTMREKIEGLLFSVVLIIGLPALIAVYALPH